MALKPKPINARWRYYLNRIDEALHFNIYIENVDTGDVIAKKTQGQKVGEDGDAAIFLYSIEFPGNGNYRIGFQAEKGQKISDIVYSGDFFWGTELPPPFGIEITQ